MTPFTFQNLGCDVFFSRYSYPPQIRQKKTKICLSVKSMHSELLWSDSQYIVSHFRAMAPTEISVGLNKGHKVTKNTLKPKVSRRKGVSDLLKISSALVFFLISIPCEIELLIVRLLMASAWSLSIRVMNTAFLWTIQWIDFVILCQAAQCNQKTPIPVSLRWQVRSEKAKKKDKHQHQLQLPPAFISLRQSQQM